MLDCARHHAIFLEWKSCKLNLHRLTNAHKACNVLVGILNLIRESGLKPRLRVRIPFNSIAPRVIGVGNEFNVLTAQLFGAAVDKVAELFGCSADNISLHLKNIFEENELVETATSENFSVVHLEGERQVSRNIKHYNLDAIISVGYRVKSVIATRFRIWATQQLKEYIIKGFVMNDVRLKNLSLA